MIPLFKQCLVGKRRSSTNKSKRGEWREGGARRNNEKLGFLIKYF